MTIREALAADLEALAPLFTAYRLHFNPKADDADSLPFLRERFARGECRTFIAVDGDACAGFIQLYPLWSSWYCKRIWFLSDLYVAPAFRKAGTGKRLVQRVKAYAAETGASSVMVELPHSEPHLTRFYDELGFHRDDVFDLARFTASS